jgi:hypothetical protein
MGSFFPFLKKWVLPVSADLEDRKNTNFLQNLLCGITHGHPPTLGRGGGYYYRNNQASHSAGYRSPTLRAAGALALYHLVQAGPSPSQYALVYLWAATLTTNGLVVKKDVRRKKRKEKKDL